MSGLFIAVKDRIDVTDESVNQKAAKELAAYIRQAEAADYDYEGYYLDGPTKIKMGVKNGVPYRDI